eukprot:12544832-Prorocentrum_lima.AAC.1
MKSNTGDASLEPELEHVGRVVPTILAATVAVASVDVTWHNADAAHAVDSNLVAARMVDIA